MVHKYGQDHKDYLVAYPLPPTLRYRVVQVTPTLSQLDYHLSVLYDLSTSFQWRPQRL